MFSGLGDFFETVVMVTDHPRACDELSQVDICSPEADVYDLRTLVPPSVVDTALVLMVAGTIPKSYPVGAHAPPCYTVGESQVAFFVRSGGQQIVRDPAIRGVVVLDELQPGVKASGSYDVTLRSGAAIKGIFSGTACASVFASAPLRRCVGPAESAGLFREVCSCKLESVESDCSQAGPSSPWACRCTDAQGAASTCSVPLVAGDASDLCFEPYSTCCPMRL
jgi:hypothetical protein